ncbi:UNKNOWN [Stylonychia lemnae]|uniref:Uncharacterized protein n=1 Tax=Stylonychia lemnae TaxID=5949 RepID=A0A078AUR3_STYLE|nr:UNKNOWN [Stylonychia lemnae]|eukprot:CDW84982.1 UNKNOWN [Stylonychia lemnae]
MRASFLAPSFASLRTKQYLRPSASAIPYSGATVPNTLLPVTRSAAKILAGIPSPLCSSSSSNKPPGRAMPSGKIVLSSVKNSRPLCPSRITSTSTVLRTMTP